MRSCHVAGKEGCRMGVSNGGVKWVLWSGAFCLAHIHVSRLAQVFPHGVDDGNVAHLTALNAVRLGQLRALLDNRLRYVINPVARREPQVHVRGRHLVDVEPEVLGPAVLDEMLVLVLVATHVDRVTIIRAREVEDHAAG